MLEELTHLVLKRLNEEKETLRKEFASQHLKIPTRHFKLDNLLPEELAHKISGSFPDLNQMRLMNSHREKKYTSKDFDKFPKILKDMTFAIQQKPVIDVIEEITGIFNQHPDPDLYAGGLSAMEKGHFLNPHIDNSHDGQRQTYRTINLLYYVTPNWKKDSGGHLELWDKKVKNQIEIESFFNRLVVMETNKYSWHSVSQVNGDGHRCCISNYYFSPNSPMDYEYFNVTEFSGRPEQPLRRILSRLDNAARNGVRKIFKSGLGRKDVYQQSATDKK